MYLPPVWTKEVPQAPQRDGLKTSRSIAGARVMTASCYLYLYILHVYMHCPYYRQRFCIVTIVLGTNNMAALQNSEVSAFGSILSIVLTALRPGACQVAT